MALKTTLVSIKNRFLNILFWSVVSAAFIGPGTVTTATKAGAVFQFDLLWALLFSTFACLLLQEASARITITSGMNLGQAIAKQFEGKSTRTIVLILIIGAIILGCAAYETGNILGAVEGLKLIFGTIPPWMFVVGMVLLAAIALNLPSLQHIAKFMGMVVMLMGIAFLITSFSVKPDFMSILKGSFIPNIPDSGVAGDGLLILGLVGTTVVPYDIFLGSGVLEKKQKISEMRFGLSVAVILGGLISMAILVVGTIIYQDFSFQALSQILGNMGGALAVYVFGFGMFAAGFSSAITSPLASAITAKSLFENKNPEKWATQSTYFKIVWGSVLAVGFIFGIIQVPPVPAIILAQALNGLILPFIAIFLLFVVNDPKLMGDKVNGTVSNIMLAIVVCITLILGMIKVTQQLSDLWEFAKTKGVTSFVAIALMAMLATGYLMWKIYRDRNKYLLSAEEETK